MRKFHRKHKHTVWQNITLFLGNSKIMCRINATIHSRTENYSFTISYPKDGGSRFLHTVGNYLMKYMVSCHWENIKSDITLSGWSQLELVAPIKALKC